MTAPWLDDGDMRLYHGDALQVLASLPEGIAQTCVTSPPYWGLRDYQTGSWVGGDAACDHQRKSARNDSARLDAGLAGGHGASGANGGYGTVDAGIAFGDVCGKCGARRVDAQLGLEATPGEYVERLCAVMCEVWRVLRADGTLWLNLGDSYCSTAPGTSNAPDPRINSDNRRAAHLNYRPGTPPGLKPKDLVGVPWMVAIGLRNMGWYLRSDIIWAKPNPMPESVTDRPTKAHEYVFLLAKQPRYFYDADAIREEASPSTTPRPESSRTIAGSRARDHLQERGSGGNVNGNLGVNRPEAGRNARSVWELATQPTPEAHFATYPEALVRRCIKAGTSERGECAACGAPWQRQVEVEHEVMPDGGSKVPTRVPGGHNWADVTTKTRKHVTTTGWAPSCRCGAPPTPQLVLDPFVGSGTTALVARKHGRRCIGIDLSEEYLEIAARRTQQLSLLGEVGA